MNTVSRSEILAEGRRFVAIYFSPTVKDAMPIGKLTLEVAIPHAQSLKDRRQVVRSLKDKLRHAFNLAIAEMDEGVVWNRATIGIVCISSSNTYLTGLLEEVDKAAHRILVTLDAELQDSYAEVLVE